MVEQGNPKSLTWFSPNTRGRFIYLIEYQKTFVLYSFFSKKNRDFPIKIPIKFAQNVHNPDSAVSPSSSICRGKATRNCETIVNKPHMLIKLWICGQLIPRCCYPIVSAGGGRTSSCREYGLPHLLRKPAITPAVRFCGQFRTSARRIIP